MQPVKTSAYATAGGNPSQKAAPCRSRSRSGSSLSAINAENQQIVKQAPNFTPKSVKLGAFVLYLRFILENRDTTNVIG